VKENLYYFKQSSPPAVRSELVSDDGTSGRQLTLPEAVLPEDAA